MRVLIACEESGTVRDAFAARGHYAVSCDLLPSRTPGMHFQGDVREVLYWWRWDMILTFPPCTFVNGAGIHWNNRGRGWDQTEAAVRFARMFLAVDCDRIVLENPVGILSSRIRKPEQIIQPYEFGDDASKKTCLWLKGVPPLQATQRFAGRLVEWPKGSGKLVERWSNQTDSGQNKLPPSADRAMKRSKTYQGIADAMAAQWG